MRLGLAFLALSSIACSADALEVWLASSENCNSCAIYERAAQIRGYGRALEYSDGGGLTIPILSINKNVIAADMLRQLPPGEGPDDPNWDITLTVLVVDADRVVLAGNIAESADNAELRQPDAVMFPPASPAADDPALRETSLYADFFATHWNLEYFVDVALGKKPRRVAPRLVDLAAPEPAALDARNVVLWGSAGTPLANALFIPTRLVEVRHTLESMPLGTPRFITLFGHGPNVAGNDTSYLADGRTLFKRSSIDADYAADAAGLNAVLSAVLQTSGAHTLLVQIGHSGPVGAPLWGHGLPLTPADLAPLQRAPAGELVLVSGACNGGQFAKVGQCGFFAAHPEVRASGCQLSPSALETSDDYLRHFFRAASGAQPVTATTARRRGRPSEPSLYDAHWYASTRLEDHQLSYTTTDALIDEYFAAHPDELPASMTVAEIRAAIPTLERAEADAATALTEGLAPDLAIPLTGYVATNQAADVKLRDARELSSAERNAIVALPYKLMLPMLARRIAHAAKRVESADYRLAASCEHQSLVGFLGPSTARTR